MQGAMSGGGNLRIRTGRIPAACRNDHDVRRVACRVGAVAMRGRAGSSYVDRDGQRAGLGSIAYSRRSPLPAGSEDDSFKL